MVCVAPSREYVYFLPTHYDFATKGYRCFAARLVEKSLLVLSERVWSTQFPLGRRRLSRSSLPPPSTQRTSSISAVAAEDGVMSVSFLPGGTVIGARATLLARCIGVESVRVWWGSLKR